MFNKFNFKDHYPDMLDDVNTDAVENTIKAEATTNMVPATLLKEHKDFILYLDEDSAAGIINK